MRKVMTMLVVSISLSSFGCATTFYDSEMADENHVYVVGAKQIPFAGLKAAVWKCPVKSTSGRCIRMKITR